MLARLTVTHVLESRKLQTRKAFIRNLLFVSCESHNSNQIFNHRTGRPVDKQDLRNLRITRKLLLKWTCTLQPFESKVSTKTTVKQILLPVSKCQNLRLFSIFMSHSCHLKISEFHQPKTSHFDHTELCDY